MSDFMKAKREAESYVANADCCSPELVNLAEQFLALKAALENIEGGWVDPAIPEEAHEEFSVALQNIARTALSCSSEPSHAGSMPPIPSSLIGDEKGRMIAHTRPDRSSVQNKKARKR